MRVGLMQVDGKWPNLVLMKLSAWHKAQDHKVEWFGPIHGPYDRVYASKIFDFTPDCPYLPEGTVKGGSGYDLTTELPPEVEAMFPDYSIYGVTDTAIGFTTRGCVRNCPFCIVPKKEGRLRVVGDLHSFWRPPMKKVILLDNNLTAAPMEHFRLVLNQIIENNLQPDFSQGWDIRLLNEEHAALLSKVRVGRSGHHHFAWDNPGDEEAVRRGVALLAKYMPLRRIIFYVLVGFNTTQEEDEHRVYVLRDLGVQPFVMPYNRKDPYQRRFARYVNRKPIFMTTPRFEQYQAAERSDDE